MPDGRWRAQFNLGPIGGKRRYKVTTRKLRRDAAEWLHATQNAARNGTLTRNAVTLDQWMPAICATSPPPESNHRHWPTPPRLSLHIGPTLGHIRLDKITPADIATMYDAKLAEGLSPTSVRLLHATLRRALAVAVR